jgi:hypothetical protein
MERRSRGEAVAAHQRVTDLAIIDTLGNSDGAVQAGELLRLGLTLDVETPSLLRAVDLRLHSLDERALSLDSGMLSFRRPNRYDDRVVHAPEFLVLISAVDSIAFELVAENGFDVWRDTLWVRVNEGRDPSAPRVNSLEFWYGSDALQLRVARDDIVEDDRVENVRVFVYDGTGAMPLIQVELLAVGGNFRGSWFGAWPGAEYWLQVEVMDAEGNEGRGPRVHVELPVPGEVLVGRRHLKTVEERIGAVAYEPSGRWMAVADGERVYLYDVVGEELLHTLVVGTHVEALAIAGGDGTLSIWNVESGLLERSWFGHEGPVRIVAFAETGESVSGGKDARVRWWDIESGRAL